MAENRTSRMTAVGVQRNEASDIEAVIALIEPPAWHADAACREHPELNWFPESWEGPGRAQRICAQCLVQDECLQWALSQGKQLCGVWGGASQRQRNRRLRAISTPPAGS
jgi:Transcription factor WhiB